MKKLKIVTFLSVLMLLFSTTSGFSAVTWSNSGGQATNDGENLPLVLDRFQTSANVTLVGVTDEDGTAYGVAAANVVAGTRIYASHSNNAQIVQGQAQNPSDIDADAIEEIADEQLEEALEVAEEEEPDPGQGGLI